MLTTCLCCRWLCCACPSCRCRQAKQTSCPWKPEEVRVKHVTRYEKSREERHFDPILQYYRDPKRDEMSRTRTKQETLYKLNRARVRCREAAQSLARP